MRRNQDRNNTSQRERRERKVRRVTKVLSASAMALRILERVALEWTCDGDIEDSYDTIKIPPSA